MPMVEGLGARRAALQMLDAVLRRGQTLDAAASGARSLPAKDHALAVAIVGETLRRLRDLDMLIDGVTQTHLPDDSKARAVLRLSLAQNIGLGTPQHAVVATALPLVDGGPRRLVHGVLGTLFRRGLPNMNLPSLPLAVEERWHDFWGDRTVLAAQRQIAVRPQLDLSFADGGAAQAYAQKHGGVSLAPKHVRLKSSSVSELPGFEEGAWWVQDLAASLAARLIPSEATQVLDLCAAPGGKSMQLAAAGHRVTSVDSSASRLRRLADNLARTRLLADLIEADAFRWRPSFEFDAVLLDAPCSATGTFRRHPEVLYRARADLIVESAKQQAVLIERAGDWLKPGGTLVYSVCSLEPREGEGIVSTFLQKRADFTVDPPVALPRWVPVSKEGWIRILPGLLHEEGGLDGFFIARLVRAR
jgi:16S rRNA (cytosine967-C5)-methyltransferase